jgi:hypothetical protein
MRLASLRRPKIICSPPYVDFRYRPNTAVWLDLGHKARGEHIREIWNMKTQTMKAFNVPTPEELIQKP